VGLVVVLAGYVSFARYSIQQMRHDNDVLWGADAAASEVFHQQHEVEPHSDRPLGHPVIDPDDDNSKEQTRRPKPYPQVLRAGAAVSDAATTTQEEEDANFDALTDTAPPKTVKERKAEDVVVPAAVVAPGSSDPEGGSEGNVQSAIQEDAGEDVHAAAKETGELKKVKISASVEEKDDDDTEDTVKKETDGNDAVLLSTAKDFAAHLAALEKATQKDPEPYRKVITAYIEPPLGDTVPGTGDRGDPDKDKSFGTPTKFVVPLPRRPHGPSNLRRIEYPRVRNCNDMPGHFPIDRGLELDAEGNAVVWNVGNEPTTEDFPEQEAPFCPVELDPFLPWIHDVFPSQDGSRIEFIAQNKRRCRTGKLFTENVNRLVPQVALMQPVSVERLSEDQARELAPDLWHPEHSSSTATPSRYRLAPRDEASPDGRYTRFICRFHTTTVTADGLPQHVFLGETLSEYPFNYEFVSYRKQQVSLLSPKGKDSRLFWTSNLHFSCPLPEDRNEVLRQAVAAGTVVLKDGTPTLHVDLVPIRTSTRYNEIYLGEELIGPKSSWELSAFDPIERWGPNQVLPRVEASGRWANIPICRPPELIDLTTIQTEMDMDTFESTEVTRRLVPDIFEKPQKPHFLSACLWASTEFRTRGKVKGSLTDTLDRLKEWIEFHLMVGFDHFYVYGESIRESSVDPPCAAPPSLTMLLTPRILQTTLAPTPTKQRSNLC